MIPAAPPDPSGTAAAPRAAAAGLAAGFLVLYAATAARTVQGGDAGEFMVLGAAGGVAHPPGYPLYTLLCRVFVAALPWGTVAWRASLVSAVAAALAIGCLYGALRRLSSSPAAALLVALCCGLAPTFWRYADVAEVFALQALVACGVLLVAARVLEGWRGARPVVAVGAALAVGVANHPTTVALLPLAGWVAWRASEGGGAGAARSLLLLTVTAAAGLPAYLLLWGGGGAFAWGDTHSAAGLLHHMLRRDYGTFRLALRDEGTTTLANPAAWLAAVPREYLLVHALAMLPGLAVLSRAPTRGFMAALSASVLLAGPVLLAQFNVAPVDVGLAVVERFHILPTLLLAPWAAVGVAAVLRRARAGRLLVALLAAATLATGMVQGLAHSARHDVTWLEDYAVNTLSRVAPGAVLLGHGDDRFFGFLYARVVLGLRPDVTFVDPSLLGYPWYRAWLGRADPALDLGGAVMASLPGDAAVAVATAAQAAGRPVYLAHHYAFHEPAVLAALPPAVPAHAVMLRLTPPGAARPALADVERELVADSGQLALRSLPADQADLDERWEGESFRQYALSFTVLGNLYRAAGDDAGAARCALLAAYWGHPWRWNGAR
ncbi:MAG: DUF2723 domain-containing protein [Deltaproteobacteria bacterium]|nr:DUF2723 domain-containing protein [Deltaproteobacteria bacterium]